MCCCTCSTRYLHETTVKHHTVKVSIVIQVNTPSCSGQWWQLDSSCFKTPTVSSGTGCLVLLFTRNFEMVALWPRGTRMYYVLSLYGSLSSTSAMIDIQGQYPAAMVTVSHDHSTVVHLRILQLSVMLFSISLSSSRSPLTTLTRWDKPSCWRFKCYNRTVTPAVISYQQYHYHVL